MFVLYSSIIACALLFFQGFFPSSTTNLVIDNVPPKHICNISLNENLYGTNIKKIIFIIIDALRLDFVTPNYMPLTSHLIKENGCFNRIKVETPTVTLPRIKALAAGNIPQFIDLVLNLASTEILSDSIIHSAMKKNKSVVFYGDDTWLKLFPEKFTRFEGTNSFYVRDFTEVDDNVTRNLNIELKNDDWDIMILHYLGLDHIGHVYGPFSSLVPTKLEEMDGIIRECSENKETLLIVTGDHGMRDSGGHGGSSYSETNVPLLVIGSKCENNSFPQTDIPVNLAVLLGLDIPSLAIGKVQKSLVQLNTDKYLYVLYYNNLLLSQKGSCDLFNDAIRYYVDYLKNSNNESGFKAVKLFERCLEMVSSDLAEGSVEQNLYFLITAVFSMLILFLELLGQNRRFSDYLVGLCVVFQFLGGDNLGIFAVIFVILTLVLLERSHAFLISSKLPKNYDILYYFIFCSLLHPITFLSSSYVEEEHQFWYFFNTMFIFYQLTKFSEVKKVSDVSFCIALLVVFRFLRTMNSTGDKWANYPDLSDWFLHEKNHFWYQILFITGLVLVLLLHYSLATHRMPLANLLNLLTLVLIFVFKQEESSVFLGRIIWFLILAYYISSKSKIMTWSLILSLLLKPFNILLIPYCIVSSSYISKHYKKTEIVVLHNIFLGNMLYFAQGHSNSLASVDVSVGYIGLSSYQPVLVTAQVLCHTQAFPVLCHLLLFDNKSIKQNTIWKVLFLH